MGAYSEKALIMIEITLPDGTPKLIAVLTFPALVGWDMQQRFMEFAATTDSQVRTKYTMDVLAFAKVISGDNELPLSTDALIDNHLGSWQNIKIVFEAVLTLNGINPLTHADKPQFWSEAGEKMAVAFVAESIKLFGPALKMEIPT